MPVYALACLAAAAAFFSLGTFVYLACRPRQPMLFTSLGISPASFLSQCIAFPFHRWLPTYAHVTAFSLASCSLLSPNIRSILAAAGFWTLANVLWEFRSMSTGTVDWPDLVAACLGFGTAVAVASVLARLSPTVRSG